MITVGELARRTGVTVRALHHYDELGLVRPSARSAAGYRLYTDADVLRLHEVMILRELGLPLAEIGAVLASPAHDRAAVLRRHRAALVARRDRLDGAIAAIDRTLTTRGAAMSPDEMTELFDGFDPAAHAEEAEARWGDTDAYRESARRTARYGAAEWEAIKTESDAIYRRLAELHAAGAAPDDPRVRAAVLDHRAHRWFYPCSAELHRGLGEMYAADPRFTRTIDRYGAGLAAFLRDAFAQ